MSLKDEFWEDHHKECPWNFNGGRCYGSVSYAGHIHIQDPVYERCQQKTCPIFFWVSAIKK